MHPAPNLFDWATSELSQDAFLCWLVAHAGYPERAGLHTVARAFIAWLWNRAYPARPCDVADIALHTPPAKQQAHTDVFFAARIRGAVVPFLVEDKVHTSHHGGQLERYANWLAGQGEEMGAVDDVKAYFKTGYHFDEDLAAGEKVVKGTKYQVVGLDDVVAFFGAHTGVSEVLDDYHRHVSTMRVDRNAALDGYRDLGRDFVQYEFVRALKRACPKTVNAGILRRGTNVGGTPWTHYTVAWFPKALAGVDEVLFLRVDARQDEHGKRRYYLGLRQYGDVKGQEAARPGATKTKLARLAQHRALFDAACTDANSGLVYARPSNDYQGANESEVGLLFFDGEAQTPEVVLSRWPAVHHALVERLALMR